MEKWPASCFELRHKNGFEKEVAKLFANRLMVVPVDRLEHLVGLLEHVWLERVDRLFAIPGAAIRRPQSRDNVHKPEKFRGERSVIHESDNLVKN